MLLYPYKKSSQSAKALAKALGIKRARRDGGLIKTDVLINWGSSEILRETSAVVLNRPVSVAVACNKLSTLNVLAINGVPHPPYTSDVGVAQGWLDAGRTVMCRTKLQGHSGEGIVVVDPDEEGSHLSPAPLYTQYVPKTAEYRVHVFKGRAFFVQQKRRNKDIPDDQVNWKIRNHANGFVFAHKAVECNNLESLTDTAVSAVDALSLDFGAVDIIYNERSNSYLVLEVNTACGLEGTTLEKYVEVFSGV